MQHITLTLLSASMAAGWLLGPMQRQNCLVVHLLERRESNEAAEWAALFSRCKWKIPTLNVLSCQKAP